MVRYFKLALVKVNTAQIVLYSYGLYYFGTVCSLLVRARTTTFLCYLYGLLNLAQTFTNVDSFQILSCARCSVVQSGFTDTTSAHYLIRFNNVTSGHHETAINAISTQVINKR